MARYVIARQERGEFLAGPVVPVLDLPDAEHIHLTRRADGGWDAVPMQSFGRAATATNGGVMIEHGRWRFYSENYNVCPDSERVLWRDAPEQENDR